MKLWISDIIRWLLALLFTYTAVSKLFALQQFKWAMSQAPVIGDYAAILAVMIPAVELFLVVLLLVERTRRAGL